MARTSSSRRWLHDLILVLIVLGGAAYVMYSLLPYRTQPGDVVVPPLPDSASNATMSFLTIFIVASAVGAPVTGGVVLAIVFRLLSRRVPTDALAVPAAPKSVSKAAKSGQLAEPRELSRGEVVFWQIAATLLIIGVIVVLGIALWPTLTAWFS